MRILESKFYHIYIYISLLGSFDNCSHSFVYGSYMDMNRVSLRLRPKLLRCQTLILQEMKTMIYLYIRKISFIAQICFLLNYVIIFVCPKIMKTPWPVWQITTLTKTACCGREKVFKKSKKNI